LSDSEVNLALALVYFSRATNEGVCVSTRNKLWASRFKHLPPLEKFVLETLGDELPSITAPTISLANLPAIAELCNMPIDKFEKVMESLTKRGLVRVGPGPLIELCTFADPDEWNRKERVSETVAAAGSNGKRS
jgi:hypothetical protein